MMEEIQTAYGILKLMPEVIQVGKDIWRKLAPPKEAESPDRKDGVVGNTFYSENFKFAISIPSDQWEFWRPSTFFLASMGPAFMFPTRAIPIVILSKQIIKLFRPNVNVTTEYVGEFTNIEEMIQVSRVLQERLGMEIDEEGLYIDSEKQSGVIVSMQPYLDETMYQVQHCYLRDGIFYAVTASYVPMSSYSKGLFGGLQEIVSSFKLLKTEGE
ncbi:MAG: hypothetical protein DRI93_06405 [Aquificota bacterium]|nr:MAG: hypothetical protein DRI93_06405 [Aquificota bacterium]RLD97769.1 MAG: hypothetical protein DRI91_04550 [Aquificota bacterium]